MYRPEQALRVPRGRGTQDTRQSEFESDKNVSLRTGRMYLQEIFKVLFCFKVSVDRRAIVRPEGLSQWKITIFNWQTNESMTFCLVAQRFNHLRYRLPHKYEHNIQWGSNMTGTDLCVNMPHCAADVWPWESEATTSTLPPARVRTCSVLSGSC